MDILYVSGMCSDKKFNELFRGGIIKKLPQAQKYHSLLIEGLRENIKGNVLAVCSFPVNRRWTRRILFKHQKENLNGIEYKYPFFLNLPVVRQFCLFISSFIYSLIFLHKNKDSIAICDILTSSSSAGARLASKLLRRKCMGIVTDVPGHTTGAERKGLPNYKHWILNFLEKTSSKKLDNYDAYLLLTEAMNRVINPENKPYIVLEGHVDINMRQQTNLMDNKYEKTTVLYSGGIHKEYGLEVLVKAFISLDSNDCELHIYGDGNYKDELEAISSVNEGIKYMGVVENSKAVEAQVRAHLLINPRPTDADYIKYSFPSKNMEYMASGTPMLTTRLPGMPLEYHEYVYIIEDETLDGFRNALSFCLCLSKYSLHEKGAKAKEFVLENKNNIVQAGRLVHFIEGLI